MNALLFPNAPPTWEMLFHVLFRPYLLLYGDLGLESYEREYLKKVIIIFAKLSMHSYTESLAICLGDDLLSP